MNWKVYGRRRSHPNSRYYQEICLEELKNITKKLSYNRLYPGLNLYIFYFFPSRKYRHQKQIRCLKLKTADKTTAKQRLATKIKADFAIKHLGRGLMDTRTDSE
jgi:hypothetical protein